ncbi:FAD binding domain-containing protein [Cryomyces antarcticus]
MFEPVPHEQALADGADLHFSTEMISFQQDADDVTAPFRSKETDAKKIVRAKYMVACHGKRSSVTDQLSIKLQRHGLLSHALAIYFKTDVKKYVEGKYNGVIYINNQTVRVFNRIDKSGQQGFLVANTAGIQGSEESRFPAFHY